MRTSVSVSVTSKPSQSINNCVSMYLMFFASFKMKVMKLLHNQKSSNHSYKGILKFKKYKKFILKSLLLCAKKISRQLVICKFLIFFPIPPPMLIGTPGFAYLITFFYLPVLKLTIPIQLSQYQNFND